MADRNTTRTRESFWNLYPTMVLNLDTHCFGKQAIKKQRIYHPPASALSVIKVPVPGKGLGLLSSFRFIFILGF